MTALGHTRAYEVGGHTLNVVDAGAGPAIVLLHGAAPGASAAGTWTSLAPLLARSHRVIAPDFLGFGGSDKPLGQPYGVDLWTRQTLALADTLGLEQFSVIGNSLGGRVALQLALDAPERIERLVVMSTRVAPSRSRAQKLLRDYRPDRDLMREVLRECFAHDAATVTDRLVEARYALSAQPGAHEAIQTFFGAGASAPEEFEREVTALRHQTLVLHGRHDKVVPVSNGIRLAELMPHAELHVFADAGHWFPSERATAFHSLVTDFFAGTPAHTEAVDTVRLN
ncbi:alpha/beta fold hydrolase [Rhodococcus sp. ZPP]|uniref:alpha/beta fold hydrolase n=1 Tax=Rhodococcus sp. ZPP TaxID=2749906 RepID=UPI001AD88F8A|nr:alpha/beta hydrolase [Rhodococcus sp. ZPP]QTJ66828.1 alpha/beta fold hydrolase [Rhodococcus sp. ZPP]